jgi:hypothetical protein
MGGKTTTIASEEPRLGNLRVQTSMYGLTVPWVHGQTQMVGNLVWFGNFQAIPITSTSSSGGKGGGGVQQVDTKYEYKAAAIMALSSGPVVAVPKVWKGKQVYNSLSAAGLSLAQGQIGQAVWPWLQSSAGAQAIAYSGLAYVYAEAYPLTNQAEVENHRFEISTGHSVGSGVLDVWVDDILRDFLVLDRANAGWSLDKLAPMTALTNYVRARQLWLSVALTEQKPARDWMEGFAQICNAEWTMQGGLLDLVPRGDEAITSTYGTYTPNTTPVFDLAHGEGGDLLGPVEIEPRVNEDASNIIKLEWTHRANNYQIEVMTATDAAHIELFGERARDVIRMHEIHDAAVAQSVAQQILQREMTVWNKYKFKVPFTRALIGLMDLVTLTDADSDLERTPVRILSREEAGDLQYTYTAEDAPIGSSSAPTYGQQVGSGFGHDYNAAPGNVVAPVIFEAPTERTSTGLEVYAAVTGAGALWGGCRVWVSLDGLNYRDTGRLYGGSRYGTLTAAMGTTGNAAVQLVGQGGQMLSGSSQDAAALSTLCWAAGVSGGEYFAYETALLTAPNAYTLSSLVRGAYQNLVQTHASAAAFVRIDDAIATSGPLTDEMIGQAISFKFTSFNVYGGGEQSLADVSAYSYTVTGDQLKLPPRPFDTFNVRAQPDGTRQFNFSYTGTPPPDWKGAEIRFTTDLASTDWASMQRLQDFPTFYTNSPAETNAPIQGSYRFACRSIDRFDALSTALYVNITLPKRRTGRAFDDFDERFEGWLGTLGSMTELPTPAGSTLLEATDSTTWATTPATWDAWARWNLTPASPCSYTTPVRDLGIELAGQVDSSLLDVDGFYLLELRTSSDGVTYSAWGDAATAFTARYVQLRITFTATLAQPVPALRDWAYIVSADIKEEYYNDIDIATDARVTVIAVGDVRSPVALNFGFIREAHVVIQDTRSGWNAPTLLDRDPVLGPRWQFRLNGVLTNPALVDFINRGV